MGALGKAVYDMTGELVAGTEKALAQVWEEMGFSAMATAARQTANLMKNGLKSGVYDSILEAGGKTLGKAGVEAAETGAEKGLMKTGVDAAEAGVEKSLLKVIFSMFDEVPANQTILQEELEAAREASAQDSFLANSMFNSVLAKALGFCAVGGVGMLTLLACSKLGRNHARVPADVENFPPVHGEDFHFDQQMPLHAGGAQLHRFGAGAAQLHGPAHGQMQPGTRMCAPGAYIPVHGGQGQRGASFH